MKYDNLIATPPPRRKLRTIEEIRQTRIFDFGWFDYQRPTGQGADLTPYLKAQQERGAISNMNERPRNRRGILWTIYYWFREAI